MLSEILTGVLAFTKSKYLKDKPKVFDYIDCNFFSIIPEQFCSEEVCLVRILLYLIKKFK